LLRGSVFRGRRAALIVSLVTRTDRLTDLALNYRSIEIADGPFVSAHPGAPPNGLDIPQQAFKLEFLALCEAAL
jgi:hypothetical protein